MSVPIKNKEGIAKMREACAIAATVLENLKPLVRPGITTQDLEEAGRDWIARLGARSACYGYQHGSRRYPAHTCISVNDEIVHGIPSFRRVLRDGDVVSLDIVVWYNGYVGDNAYTVPVGAISPELTKLLRVSREAGTLSITSLKEPAGDDPGFRIVFMFTDDGPDDGGGAAGLLKLDQLGQPPFKGDLVVDKHQKSVHRGYFKGSVTAPAIPGRGSWM